MVLVARSIARINSPMLPRPQVSSSSSPRNLEAWATSMGTRRTRTWRPRRHYAKSYIKDIDLPYAVFYNGFFSDRFFSPDLTKISGLDFANGKATVNGVGDALISFTTRQDIAVYTAYVLTSLPRESLEWRTFHIQGDAMVNKIRFLHLHSN